MTGQRDYAGAGVADQTNNKSPPRTPPPPKKNITPPNPTNNNNMQQGNVTVLGRESPFALYSADLASMEIEGGGAAFDYNPYDAQVRTAQQMKWGIAWVPVSFPWWWWGFVRMDEVLYMPKPIHFVLTHTNTIHHTHARTQTGLHPHQRRAAPRVQPPPAHLRLQVNASMLCHGMPERVKSVVFLCLPRRGGVGLVAGCLEWGGGGGWKGGLDGSVVSYSDAGTVLVYFNLFAYHFWRERRERACVRVCSPLTGKCEQYNTWEGEASLCKQRKEATKNPI